MNEEFGQSDPPSIPPGMIEKLKADDQEAWHALYEKYAHRLKALIGNRVHDPDLEVALDSSGVVQETFLAFHENLERFEFRGRLWPYLAQIVARQLFKRIRFSQAQQRDVSRKSQIGDMQPSDDRLNPEMEAIWNELVGQLTFGLSQSQRDVVLMYLDGKSTRMIAKELKSNGQFVNSVLNIVEQRLAGLKAEFGNDS